MIFLHLFPSHRWETGIGAGIRLINRLGVFLCNVLAHLPSGENDERFDSPCREKEEAE